MIGLTVTMPELHILQSPVFIGFTVVMAVGGGQ